VLAIRAKLCGCSGGGYCPDSPAACLYDNSALVVTSLVDGIIGEVLEIYQMTVLCSCLLISCCRRSLMEMLPVCQVGITASGTWKFPNLLTMTNEKVHEPVSR
jgi:hypothetical protein